MSSRPTQCWTPHSNPAQGCMPGVCWCIQGGYLCLQLKKGPWDAQCSGVGDCLLPRDQWVEEHHSRRSTIAKGAGLPSPPEPRQGDCLGSFTFQENTRGCDLSMRSSVPHKVALGPWQCLCAPPELGTQPTPKGEEETHGR